MQHRAPWTASGDTWGLPGGARDSHESARETALREAAEEAGVAPDAVRVLDELRDDHGGWRYITVVAEAAAGSTSWPTRRAWTCAGSPRPRSSSCTLHPGFARTWPLLRESEGGPEPARSWRGQQPGAGSAAEQRRPSCAACR